MIIKYPFRWERYRPESDQQNVTDEGLKINTYLQTGWAGPVEDAGETEGHKNHAHQHAKPLQ